LIKKEVIKMATYDGAIIKSSILSSERVTDIKGHVVTQGDVLHGNITRIRSGLNVKDFNITVFTRIPKEHILNKFSSLGGNVRF